MEKGAGSPRTFKVRGAPPLPSLVALPRSSHAAPGKVEILELACNAARDNKKSHIESAGWTVKQIIFVGGTCGSVHVQTFNSNLKEFGVVESKRNTIRRGFVHELLNAQDTVLCSYFAQRKGTKNDGCGQKSEGEEIFQGLERFE
jgi:hypothetical protein